MYSLKKNSLEIVAAILAIVLVFLLLGKIKVGEHATGFYIVRPTYWKVTPSLATIEITSFYPSSLICEVNTPVGSRTVEIDPRDSVVLELNVDYLPGKYVTIPISIDCGYVRENGKIYAFVFT